MQLFYGQKSDLMHVHKARRADDNGQWNLLT